MLLSWVRRGGRLVPPFVPTLPKPVRVGQQVPGFRVADPVRQSLRCPYFRTLIRYPDRWHVQVKSEQDTDLLPIQCKMARAATGLGVRELAEASQVSADTIVRFEKGIELRPRTVGAIRAALEAAGIEFIPENGGGTGVRMRKATVGGS